MYESLQPYLHDTYAKRLITNAITEYKTPTSGTLKTVVKIFDVKIKSVGAIIVGIAETIAYLAMAIFSKCFSLFVPHASHQAHKYFNLSKGAGIGSLIGGLCVFSMGKGAGIVEKIEESVHITFESVAKKAKKSLEDKICQVSNQQLEEYKKNKIPFSQINMPLWDKQCQDLRDKMNGIVNNLIICYASPNNPNKFDKLIEAQKSIHEIMDAVDTLVMIKK